MINIIPLLAGLTHTCIWNVLSNYVLWLFRMEWPFNWECWSVLFTIAISFSYFHKYIVYAINFLRTYKFEIPFGCHFLLISVTASFVSNIGITNVFSCINICRVPRKLFEHKAIRPSVQTSSEGTGNEMKQTCVIVILAYFTWFQQNTHRKHR